MHTHILTHTHIYTHFHIHTPLFSVAFWWGSCWVLEVELQFIWQALYFAQQIIAHNFTFPACGLWTPFSLPFRSRKSSSQRKITWSAVVHSCSHHFKSIPRRGWKCECMHILKLSHSISRSALFYSQ